MTITRFLAPLPADYSLGQLVEATQARFPSARGINTYGTNLAVYFDGDPPPEPELTSWRAAVAAHVPQHPTPEEQALAALSNDATLRQQAVQALATNRTYIQRTSPTAAQTTAQVKALSQQMNGLIRLVVGRLEGTD